VVFYPSMINVEVSKNGTESSGNLLRRFSRKVQSSGVIYKVRGSRYFERPKSPHGKKRDVLRKLQRRGEYEQKVKLGLIEERTRGRRR